LNVLARSFLAGEPTVEQIVVRCTQTLDRPWRWLRPLARRYIKAFSGQTRPRHRDVVQFLSNDSGFARAQSKYGYELSLKRWLTEPQQMQPVLATATWNIPTIESIGDLADWLLLDSSELEWFADLKGLGRQKIDPRLSHYHYRVLSKRSGNIRLIEAPKSRLKQLQRQILTRILNEVPPHPAVHGFIKGRSIKTFVAPHVGQRIVLRMDLQDFFPSLSAARIQTIFRTAGYPESVADRLGGICTNAAPRNLWNKPSFDIDPIQLKDAGTLYSRPHLPQGAPTSPTLANLCAYRMDCRLNGLAQSIGAKYTRYADDLAFSGSQAFERCIERFSTHVAAIVREEGFTVHHRKTRIMRQGVRQHLAGLIINQHANIVRTDFDRLKATLTNCVRLGPESQNHEAHPHFRLHLEGRLSFVQMVNPAKARRLRAIFEQIRWQ
jgi:RNA-directed DNA polymerase